MIPEQYVWSVWASAFLLPWLLIYALVPSQRRIMWRVSLFTAIFGLTEPLFVPEYWSPPSLFNLAMRTGFDIESLIFCFGIGGVGAVLYNLVTGARLVSVADNERHGALHRYHKLALLSPFLVFPPLYFLNWNPIYPAIVAMLVGGVATVLCRPDLKHTTWLGSVLFVAYYWLFLKGLEWLSPGYIERVWNLGALSGVHVIGVPLEELLFAAGFGLYWAGLYGHYGWRRPQAVYG